MFKFLAKYKFQFNILAVIVFAAGSVFNFIDYSKGKGDTSDLFLGIVFGIGAIIRMVEIVDNLITRSKIE